VRQKIPIHREDDGEFLGFIAQDAAGWDAQTIFGYSILRTTNKATAEDTVRAKGLGFLTGLWQYFDKDDQDWHSCVLKESHEHQVTVIRTNYMGYRDPDDFKIVTIDNPDETKLIKTT